jgi:Mycothiol maleylpyruvate isomerase N-terminal domain
MMHTSTLEREELRIFEELISRLDSLSEAQMNAVGVTPEWSAKDLLAHLAYWERAAAEQVRDFEAGRWSAKKRTRARMERINREVVSANRATPQRGTDAGEERNRGGDETSARGTGGKVSARSYRLLSVRAAHGDHLEQLQAWVARLGKTS